MRARPSGPATADQLKPTEGAATVRLRILGCNSDEKGSQLEALAGRLLRRLGYKRVTLNSVGTGGHELDIRAEHPLPGLDEQKAICVVGECKAYETALTTPDWLRFLGKVFLEEARLRAEVQAVLIALSGVNGPVAGAYDDLKRQRSNVSVVAGERLAELVSSEFGLVPVDQVATYVRNATTVPAIALSLAYYREAVFWIIELADGHFAVLEGNRPEKTAPAQIVDMAKLTLPASAFRDLTAEAEACRRRLLASKLVLSVLLAADKSLSLDELCDDCKDSARDERLTDTELHDAISTLQTDSLLALSPNQRWVLPNLVQDIAARVRFLQHLTDGFLVLRPLGTANYNRLIDDTLLAEISSIQGGVPILSEHRLEHLHLLRWSPSALSWALRPDPMLVKHREDGFVNPQADANDVRYLRTQLLRRAVANFQEPALTRIYFEPLGIRELEFTRRAIFKGPAGILLDAEVQERHGILPAANELGGGLVRVWIHTEAPEPWALPSASDTPVGFSDSSAKDASGSGDPPAGDADCGEETDEPG